MSASIFVQSHWHIAVMLEPILLGLGNSTMVKYISVHVIPTQIISQLRKRRRRAAPVQQATRPWWDSGQTIVTH
jgi:hypothetical protein